MFHFADLKKGSLTTVGSSGGFIDLMDHLSFYRFACVKILTITIFVTTSYDQSRLQPINWIIYDLFVGKYRAVASHVKNKANIHAHYPSFLIV